VILTVPKDDTLYPTLGPQVCDFIERNMVYGPGDLRGKPIQLDAERVFLIYRMYEVFPKGHPQAGRRRFRRVAVSLPKGLGKTEFAAIITACELHPEAPVRCTGWTDDGEPIGGPVTDPYIPLVATNEQQSTDLAYAALKAIIEEGPLDDDFVCTDERIERKRGGGVAVSVSNSPNARDGARTTFMVFDETHRFTLPRIKHAHQTMVANLGKRPLADPWALEITTAPEPGTGSVAESTMDYAVQVDQGRITNASFFFFHRQAGNEHDLSTIEGARAAVIEASGEAAAWRDIEGIVGQWSDPTMDRAYWERVWCNRLVKGSTQAFNIELWKPLAKPTYRPRPGALITVGFDGSRSGDATGLIACEVETGFQWKPGLWEAKPGPAEFKVPADEVDATVRRLFDDYRVWRMYADPWMWQSEIAAWQRAFDTVNGQLKPLSERRVIEWETNRRRQMSYALENFDTAIKTGLISHDGDKDLQRHLGNSRKKELPGERDEQGKPFWLIQKERPESPLKIDLAMAAVLSWEARTDAIAAGVALEPVTVLAEWF
jgi:hypothetical protein